MSSAFVDFYRQLYQGRDPFPYQVRLAAALVSDRPPNCLAVPTGCGKESAAIAAFLWQWQQVQRWRRLVYCLPTRALVDQVSANTEAAIASLGVEVYVLKGGAVDHDWVRDPQQAAILVGTQDQLLSRALNRGYSLSPYQWPIHFGLVSQDALWIFDETQLMGAGFDTSIQLQGLRDRFFNLHATHSLWLSATLDESRLQSVDYGQPLVKVDLAADDRQVPVLQQRLTARKALLPWAAKGKDQWTEVAAAAIAAVEWGKVLIVVNRVDRAQAIAQALEKQQHDYRLVHSRFREEDRPRLEALKDFPGIIVATQAIEAGVDLDAKTLFTELCPWPSLVQRVGRCNRQGQFEEATVYWLDVKDKDALPYDAAELAQCRQVLVAEGEIGIEAIEEIRQRYGLKLKREFTPVPRRKDLLELFHTDEDLQGSRTDVGQFVRGLKDEDVQLGWRDFAGDPNPDRGQLRREELCRVRIGAAKEFLKDKPAYLWSWTKRRESDRTQRGAYEKVDVSQLRPGLILLLPCSIGGYSDKFGFTGDPKDKPRDLQCEAIAHESMTDDNSSQTNALVTLRTHSSDVARECEALASLLPEALRAELVRAGRWHDAGKAHPDWQCAIGLDGLYAKTTRQAWKGINPDRRGLRHELASMLMARNHGESVLLQYLVLCHHGKVRTCIEPWPSDREKQVRGIEEGDVVKPVGLGEDLDNLPEATRTLHLAGVAYWNGAWTEEVEALIEEYGPFSLAYLEALLRIADWRASENPSLTDPSPGTEIGGTIDGAA